MTTERNAQGVGVLGTLAALALLVRLHEGNKDELVNKLLLDSIAARDAVAELVEKAAAILGMVDACGCWNASADDLRAALARFQTGRCGVSGSIGHDLWLWRDGDGFLAFSNEYPRYPNGDPMTAGEPAARAKFVASLPRALSHAAPSEDEMLAWAAGWRSEDDEPEGLTTEQRMVWCIVRAIRREMTINRPATGASA